MPLILSRNDITKAGADAVVLPANEELLQGPGTSRAIFLAAGEDELTAACRKIGHCPVGDAVMTPGFHMPVKKIIHAVCPRWQGGDQGEAGYLYSAYQKSLQLAWNAGLASIAFPLLSAGNYGYPKAEALNVTNHAITDFLMDHDMDVLLVFYDSDSVTAGRQIFREIEEYIDDNYVGSRDESFERSRMQYQSSSAQSFSDMMAEEAASPLPSDAMMSPMASEARQCYTPGSSKAKSLKDRVRSLMKGDAETFHDMLMRLIDESGMSYPQVYNRANMSKKLFSKIKLNPDSTPKKKNIIALAIALRLDMEQTEELLMKAGYALSNSSMADVIISYFIEKRIYDVFEINEALFEYGLENDLLGF